ncbi:MAG TPA: thioesterase family protein [Xanthobacteraceae bacterium]|nr:thioesterase family protein [Xanthobacteraceae bacterium]
MQQPSLERTAAPRLESFKIRTPEIVRFGDMDRQGHVNNAVYSTYLETGRVSVIFDPDQGLQVAGATTVLARIQIDFLKELRWPGQIEVGTAVGDIGRSSYVFTQGIFCDGVCVASGRSTMVLIDLETRRAKPLPPILLERLQRLQLKKD